MPGTTLLSMVARLSEPCRSCWTSSASRVVIWREGATRLFCVRAVTVTAPSSAPSRAALEAGTSADLAAGADSGSSTKLPGLTWRTPNPEFSSKWAKPPSMENCPDKPRTLIPLSCFKSTLRLTPACAANAITAGPSGPA